MRCASFARMDAIYFISGTERRSVPLDDIGRDLTDRDHNDRALRAARERMGHVPTCVAMSTSVGDEPAAWPLHDKTQSAS